MAELVDAADSKSAVRKDVQVRFLFWAQAPFLRGFFITPEFSTGNTFKDFPFLSFPFF